MDLSTRWTTWLLHKLYGALWINSESQVQPNKHKSTSKKKRYAGYLPFATYKDEKNEEQLLCWEETATTSPINNYACSTVLSQQNM